MQLYVAVSNMFYFSPLFGEDFQFDYLMFFRWVETTNQIFLLIFFEVVFGQLRLTSYLNRMLETWVFFFQPRSAWKELQAMNHNDAL